MPNGVKKEHLPSKVCVICNRPFTWRKKWEAVWDDVTTCSKSCNHKRRALNQHANRQEKNNNNSNNNSVIVSSESPSVPQQQEEGAKKVNKKDKHKKYVAGEEEEEEGVENNKSKQYEFHDDNDNTIDLSILKDIMNHVSHDNHDRSDSESTSASPVGSNHSDGNDHGVSLSSSPVDSRAARKEAKKRMKQERRAKRQGLDPNYGQKECNVCHKNVDLLIRCTIDPSLEWKMVCGKCWHAVSGGVVDGDANHPYYRYGGLWKNRAKRV